jgi:hypothetical protein
MEERQINSDRWPLLKASWESDIQEACYKITKDSIVSPRDLQTCLFLHLPRFSQDQINHTVITSEVDRLFTLLLSRRRDYEQWIKRPKISELIQADIAVRCCEDEIAQAVYERFHYIGSPRKGLVHLALYHCSEPDIPMAIMTVSRMDVRHLETLFGPGAEQVAILARSYAFDWAPRNSISFLTGQLRKWLQREMPVLQSLVSYINPNLGFLGTSYAASGWQLFGSKGVIYRYLRNQYLSYRQASSLSAEDAPQVVSSRLNLMPLTLMITHTSRGREVRNGS